MKPSLSLGMSQQLALTPQLQQAIRLLQLSTLELEQDIEHMLVDNPFLEREEGNAPLVAGLEVADARVSLGDRISEAAQEGGDEAVELGDASPVQDVDLNWEGDGGWEVAPDDAEWGMEAPAHPSAITQDASEASEWARSAESLQAHLQQQALALRVSPVEHAALAVLIESLSDDGYLEDRLETLANSLATEAEPGQAEQLLEHFKVALHLLQSLEPAGVGARDLAECLQLQCRERLRQSPQDEVAALALRLCAQPLTLLAKRDAKRLAGLLDVPEAQVRHALQFITRLEPKPGRRFAVLTQHTVLPDVIVTRVQRASGVAFHVQLNPEVLPKLRVHDLYAQALRGHKGEAVQGLQQRLQEARWFIKSIQQRFDTILRVAQAIVERQHAFLLRGELAMRPLVMREIADALGLHESTISRVTTAKYMSTPQGTFEFKHFFGSGLDSTSGQSVSSTAVRVLIRQIIDSENPQKPLSDQQISDLLKVQGIDCARRTVAKYRESLKIATAHLRKVL